VKSSMDSDIMALSSNRLVVKRWARSGCSMRSAPLRLVWSRSSHPSGWPLNNGDSRRDSSGKSVAGPGRRRAQPWTWSQKALQVLYFQRTCSPSRGPGTAVLGLAPANHVWVQRYLSSLQIFRWKSCPTATPSFKRYLSTRQKTSA